MTEESHPLAGGWLDEADFRSDPDNIDEVAPFAKPGDDHPLSYDAKVDPARVERLGLPAPRSKPILQVRNAILGETMLAHLAGRWVSYSRNNNFYAQEARYRGLPFTRGNIFETIDLLGGLGLIEEERARPGDHLRTQMQSRFRATSKLVELWGADAASYSYDPHETIRRKNAEGLLVDYSDSDERRRWRRDVEAYNEAINATSIVLAAPDVEWNTTMVRVPTSDGDEAIFIPWRKATYRVFNGGWHLGGRLYGPFYQGLAKERRAQLLMNGSPVQEHDHSQIHARLLYAEFGLQVDGDAYTVPGHEHRRPTFKVAWQIMINARDRRQGVHALAVRLAEQALRRDEHSKHEARKLAPSIAHKIRKEASEILALLEQRHAAVAAAFYTGAGLRLQRTDSEMCTRVNKRALDDGFVPGSVHDSHFAEKGRNSDRLQEFMADEMARVTNTPKPCPIRLPASSVLQMVDGPGDVALSPAKDRRATPARLSLVPSVQLVTRELHEKIGLLENRVIQLSFIGLLDPPGHTPELAALGAALEYEGGIVPGPVIRYIRDARRRRGVRQEDMARALGISRPQLANAERQRFGLGPKPAARLREWMGFAA
jgi:hypothetical protein